jgi:transcriptional regulator with XRE-family HTH domain
MLDQKRRFIFLMLGQILQKALKDANISAVDAADYMGISEGNLYRLFKKDSFEVAYLKKAADLLKLPVSYFFGEELTNVPVKTTQTGDFNQAGNGNNQKVKVDKGQPQQDLAAALAACQRELALANALVAAKDETITLLRASITRPTS